MQRYGSALGYLLLAASALLPLVPPESDGRAALSVGLLAAALFVAAARPSPSRLLLAATVFGACGVSLSLAPSPAAGVTPLATWGLAAMLFFVGSASSSGRLGPVAASPAVWGDLLGGLAAVLAALAIYQRAFGLERLAARIAADPTLPDRQLLLDRISDGRAFGTLATPAALGILLAMALPGLALAAWRSRGTGRWLRGLLVALIAVGLAATESITAIATLGAIGALLVARRWTRRSWAPLVALVLLAAIAAGALALRGGEVLDPDAPRGPIRLRLGNFQVAAAMIADDPLRGVGPGGFAEAYPSYRRADDNVTRRAHNLPLEVTAELGLPLGAAIALGLLWLGLAPLFRDREPGTAAAVAILTLHNLIDFTLFLPSLLWLGAILAGRLHASRCDGGRAWIAALPAVALIVAVVGLDGLSEESLRRSRAAAAAADRVVAESEARAAVARAPWNLDAWVALGSTVTADASGAPDLGELGERVVALAPWRATARMIRARARLIQGDAVGAYVDLRRAAELHPADRSYREARDALAARLGEGAP